MSTQPLSPRAALHLLLRHLRMHAVTCAPHTRCEMSAVLGQTRTTSMRLVLPRWPSPPLRPAGKVGDWNIGTLRRPRTYGTFADH